MVTNAHGTTMSEEGSALEEVHVSEMMVIGVSATVRFNSCGDLTAGRTLGPLPWADIAFSLGEQAGNHPPLT
jgi:hypothetical protein